MKLKNKREKKIWEKAQYEQWKRDGMPMLCFRCGNLITWWDLFFRRNYEHCIIGDSHKICKEPKQEK